MKYLVEIHLEKTAFYSVEATNAHEATALVDKKLKSMAFRDDLDQQASVGKAHAVRATPDVDVR